MSYRLLSRCLFLFLNACGGSGSRCQADLQDRPGVSLVGARVDRARKKALIIYVKRSWLT